MVLVRCDIPDVHDRSLRPGETAGLGHSHFTRSYGHLARAGDRNRRGRDHLAFGGIRKCALGVFGLTTAKVFLYDVSVSRSQDSDRAFVAWEWP